MVLRQQVDGETVFEDRDVRVLFHRLHERPFDLGSREVLVVEDAVLRVTALAVEFETPVGGLVEARAPSDQVPDQLRSPPHDQLHGLFIALARSADQRVADVFFECVGGVCHRADTALGIVGVALFDLAFGDDRNVSVSRGFQREREPRSAGTDNQKVGFHGFFLFLLPCSAAKLQKIVTLPHNFRQNMERHIDINRYDYDLPEERIAKFPLAERSASKLLVWRGGGISERHFADIGDVLPAGELLVFNNTKVIRARIITHKPSGARIEVFCLEPHDPADYERAFAVTGGCTWSCIVGNRKKWKEGYVEINFDGETPPGVDRRGPRPRMRRALRVERPDELWAAAGAPRADSDSALPEPRERGDRQHALPDGLFRNSRGRWRRRPPACISRPS